MLNTTTFYFEEADECKVDFNGENIMFTLIIIKISTNSYG